ncbi:hypothetical protein [Thermosipho atlanticus]|uniref:PNPLA domain-containing protein n=1 Tax=Thermosipho atlanticus DSM 15807 TaxID=1123380 RepID=A0A1M5SMT5_9BACT|nr:hypothetical protein [Thermosipho atlanticus]SHH39879.1 hypothetical protein SAMN02745199_0969 [Thermosipho atlanticus DSM 15807]
MRIHVGGYGLQGLAAIPVIEKFLSKKDKNLEIIANGLAGFYAILFENFGSEKAREKINSFVKKFESTFRVINRVQKGEEIDKRKARKKKIKYCVLWSTSIAIHERKEIEEFLGDLNINTCVKAEVINLEKQTVELYEGSSYNVAKACLAFPGVFPPFKGKYVNTTYLSQIPVSFIEDGDIVVLNFRDLPQIKFESASEILLQAMECRMIEFAKRVLKSKNVEKIEI